MFRKTLYTAALVIVSMTVYAQVDSFKVNLDLRTRGEFDNGQKTLISKGKSPETTVLSRARFGFDYSFQDLEVVFSIQDVRTWGEAVTSSPKNQSLILNEAWAKYRLSKQIALKIGRQTLSYDDERLIGELDWVMQGRSFDAAKGIFVFNKNARLEAVVAYNNDNNDANDTYSKEIYDVSEADEKSKSLQILHYQYKGANQFQFSSILMNNIVQNASGNHFDVLTTGINVKKYYKNFGLFGSAYYQAGKNTIGQVKSAYQFSVNADFIINKTFNTVLGTEWLSGKNFDTNANNNRSFSPMYGTNHKFNGFMDYFYVGNYFNGYGLNDFYVKTTTKFTPKSRLLTNLHAFTANGKLGGNNSAYLGSELDMLFICRLNKDINISLGHSFIFAEDSLKMLKSVANAKSLQNFAWVGFNFSPSFRLK